MLISRIQCCSIGKNTLTLIIIDVIYHVILIIYTQVFFINNLTVIKLTNYKVLKKLKRLLTEPLILVDINMCFF
jgi:hypothetical protein